VEGGGIIIEDKVQHWHFSHYLSRTSVEIWNVVIEKFEKRLASWQLQFLSLGGRSIVFVIICGVCSSLFWVYNGLCLALSGKLLSVGVLGKLGTPSEESGSMCWGWSKDRVLE
ncbi:hypothetical protein H5410_015783, partial [Solanum commersonii]